MNTLTLCTWEGSAVEKLLKDRPWLYVCRYINRVSVAGRRGRRTIVVVSTRSTRPLHQLSSGETRRSWAFPGGCAHWVCSRRYYGAVARELAMYLRA